MAFAHALELAKLLGPFKYAGSPDPAHRAAIAQVINAQVVYVAECGAEVAGMLRGRDGRLGSLFVSASRQRQGIGRRLVERSEQESISRGVTVIHVAATLNAVPFYSALGYRKTTGVRNGWSFEARGLCYQPMKKALLTSPVQALPA